MSCRVCFSVYLCFLFLTLSLSVPLSFSAAHPFTSLAPSLLPHPFHPYLSLALSSFSHLSQSCSPPIASSLSPPPLSKMSLVTSLDRKSKHTSAGMFTLSLCVYPIWKTLGCPENMTTHTEQGGKKGNIHYIGNNTGMAEEKWGRTISTEGWRRDGLLIVCVGRSVVTFVNRCMSSTFVRVWFASPIRFCRVWSIR